MILFAAGRGELLKRFLVEDGIGKGRSLLETGSIPVRSLSQRMRRKTLGRWRAGEEEGAGTMNDLLVDTQIVSIAFKGKDDASERLVRESQISSVTACEFLLAHGNGTSKPDYYALPAKRYLPAASSMLFDNDHWETKSGRKGVTAEPIR